MDSDGHDVSYREELPCLPVNTDIELQDQQLGLKTPEPTVPDEPDRGGLVY